MQLTISSDDPIEKVLAAVGALLGVELTVSTKPEPQAHVLDGDDTQGITRPRPT